MKFIKVAFAAGSFASAVYLDANNEDISKIPRWVRWGVVAAVGISCGLLLTIPVVREAFTGSSVAGLILVPLVLTWITTAVTNMLTGGDERKSKVSSTLVVEACALNTVRYVKSPAAAGILLVLSVWSIFKCARAYADWDDFQAAEEARKAAKEARFRHWFGFHPSDWFGEEETEETSGSTEGTEKETSGSDKGTEKETSGSTEGTEKETSGSDKGTVEGTEDPKQETVQAQEQPKTKQREEEKSVSDIDKEQLDEELDLIRKERKDKIDAAKEKEEFQKYCDDLKKRVDSCDEDTVEMDPNTPPASVIDDIFK